MTTPLSGIRNFCICARAARCTTGSSVSCATRPSLSGAMTRCGRRSSRNRSSPSSLGTSAAFRCNRRSGLSKLTLPRMIGTSAAIRPAAAASPRYFPNRRIDPDRVSGVGSIRPKYPRPARGPAGAAPPARLPLARPCDADPFRFGVCCTIAFPEVRSTSAMSDTQISDRFEVDNTSVLMLLAGPQSSLLAEVARQSGAEVSLRGNVIHFLGSEHDVRIAHRFVSDAAELVAKGFEINESDVVSSIRGLRADPNRSLTELLDETIIVNTRRKPIRPKSAAQQQYVEAIRTHDLTFGIGPAGTGKTYLAMAMAAAALMQKRVKRIILARPAVEAGEKLGFLPGDMAEKVNPYLRPLYDALNDMLEFDRVEQLRDRGQIEVAPLAFMRGRTLNDSFVILDEAQNATSEQMRMFLTRLGFGSKCVVTGDITQTDLPSGARSGLREARELLSGTEGISFCGFSDEDVVRHPLVQKIIVAYEKRDREQEQRRAAKAVAATTTLPPDTERS